MEQTSSNAEHNMTDEIIEELGSAIDNTDEEEKDEVKEDKKIDHHKKSQHSTASKQKKNDEDDENSIEFICDIERNEIDLYADLEDFIVPSK